MAGESRIDIIIAARDQAKGVIQGVNQELGTMNQAAASASSGITALGGALTLVGAIQVGRVALDLAQIGAQAQRVDLAFQKLAQSAGQSGNQLLAAMRKASAGTIADVDLELAANRARILGVADSAEKLTGLLEVARVRGAAFGRSTAQSFDDLVTGIGRGSALILDNLGFKDGQRDLDAYAASVGKTAAELSNAERTSVLLNKVMRETKDEVAGASKSGEDAATAFEHLQASITNVKAALGKGIANDAGGGIGFIANALDAYSKQLEIATSKSRPGLFQPITQGFIEQAEAAQYAADVEQHLEDIHASYGVSAQNAASATASFDAELAKLAPDLQYLGDLALTTGSKIDALRSALAGVRAANADINAAQSSAASAIINAAKSALPILGKDEALRMAQQQLATLEGQTEALKQQGKAGADLQLTYADLENQLKAPFENVVEQQRQAESASKRWASTVQNDLVKAYNDLQGKVKSVLGGAFNVDVGVDPDKILGRSDAINEPARRLADVAVNGFKSPWLEYFRTDFPQLFQEFFAGAAGDEGVKKNAAQLLKNFEDGLAPELIDKEKAKERVRRMILGEQATDELVKEITDELNAEFGRTAPADLGSLVQQAVGGGTQGKAAGISTEAAGKAFNDAALTAVSQTGNKVISTVDEQLRADANLAKLGQAGNIGGTKYGAEFLSGAINNIAQPFLDYVTKIVTGNVIANINTQNQLKGANP